MEALKKHLVNQIIHHNSKVSEAQADAYNLGAGAHPEKFNDLLQLIVTNQSAAGYLNTFIKNLDEQFADSYGIHTPRELIVSCAEISRKLIGLLYTDLHSRTVIPRVSNIILRNNTALVEIILDEQNRIAIENG